MTSTGRRLHTRNQRLPYFSSTLERFPSQFLYHRHMVAEYCEKESDYVSSANQQCKGIGMIYMDADGINALDFKTSSLGFVNIKPERG